MARLLIHLTPSASREAVLGRHGDAIKVAVTSPAEKGKANSALVKLIARELNVPGSAVRIVAGATKRRKVLAIDGASQEGVDAWLERRSRTT